MFTATADILMSQQCAKVFVGDPHQHVYGFRGAINVLEELEGTTHSYSLTQVRETETAIRALSLCAHVIDILHTLVIQLQWINKHM